jgi:hypothetical protein
MTYDKNLFDSLKLILKGVVRLSDEEISNLEKRCFEYAATTVRPNNEVTYLLMEKAYRLIPPSRGLVCKDKTISSQWSPSRHSFQK